MKFKTIWVEGLQAVKSPIRIDLDPNYNSIRGPSDTGKSAIFTKSVLLFTGKYDLYDLETIQNYNSTRTTVAIELDDGLEYPKNRIMRADIEDQRVSYTLFQDNAILKVWQGYNKEISQIMGLITTNDICVNVLESTKRLFLDTTEDANTELLEELFTNKELEQKILDINRYSEDLDARYKYSVKVYESHRSKIRPSRQEEIKSLQLAEQDLAQLKIKEKANTMIRTLVENRASQLRKQSLEEIQHTILLKQLISHKETSETMHKKIEALETASNTLLKMNNLNNMKMLVEIKEQTYNNKTHLQEKAKQAELYNKIIENQNTQNQLNLLAQIVEIKNRLTATDLPGLVSYSDMIKLKIVIEEKSNTIIQGETLRTNHNKMETLKESYNAISIIKDYINIKENNTENLNRRQVLGLQSYTYLIKELGQLRQHQMHLTSQLKEFRYCPLCNSLIEK